MLIGIMADSHENLSAIGKAVDLFNEKGIDHLYHAGDIISPITFTEFKRLNCPMDLVFGNNDGEKHFLREKFAGKGVFHEHMYSFEIDEKKFLMMHEANNLEHLSLCGCYDCIIYGHTHEIDIRKVGRTLVLNPGENCGLLTGKASVVLLETASMKHELVFLV